MWNLNPILLTRLGVSDHGTTQVKPMVLESRAESLLFKEKKKRWEGGKKKIPYAEQKMMSKIAKSRMQVLGLSFGESMETM